ncbi:hypothetical protein CSB11_00660 [Candidatus Campbellbacteria bacterium]|nr:MAG: hypothetical protein CSB11_00660 [Candidatus Campbellbacteria bacterium]
MRKIFLSLTFVLFTPSLVLGQVIFSEIMYNPEGSDTGYEWIEIYNTSGQNIDLSDWRFCENTKCHLLKPEIQGGNVLIAPNSFAAITSSIEKYYEVSTFSDNVIKSSFSLSNKGEKLILKNQNGKISDEVEYSKSMGGNGTSDTISLVDNTWQNSQNTLGSENIAKEISNSSNDNENQNSSDSTSSDNGSFEVDETKEKKIEKRKSSKKSIKVGIDQTGILLPKTETRFDLYLSGLKKENLEKNDIVWSMGNGDTMRGKSFHYQYDFPGEYIVNVEVLNKEKQINGVIKIKVIEPKLEISKVDYQNHFVEIKNNSEYILDLSGWQIASGKNKFSIPEKTYINAFGKIIFPKKITWLEFSKNQNVFLNYPDGKNFFRYNFYNQVKKEILEKQKKIEELKIEQKEKKKKSFQKAQIYKPYVQRTTQKENFENKNGDIEEKVTENKNIKEELEQDIQSIDNLIQDAEKNGYQKTVLEQNENQGSFWKENLFLIIFISFQLIIIIILFVYKILNHKENIENQFEIEDFEE